jgi:TrmH family RNA methyltransferase
MCALVRTPSCACPDAYPEGLVVVLDRLQDPGNLGTIVRTADALGAAGVLIGAGCADPFSPKALRAAMGSTYHLPMWIGSLETELTRLRTQGFTCICGHLGGEETLPRITKRTALVIGNEGQGVSDRTAQMCIRYRMPMRGRAESLNAAVFAALMMQTLLNTMPE